MSRCSRLYLLAAASALHWCASVHTSHGQVPIFAQGQGERQLAGYQWDTLWTFGGPGDTVLASAAAIVPDDVGGLYIADPLSFRVHYLDSRGRLQWSWGREGGGPGEVRVVRAIALDGDSGLVLADPGNRRVVKIGRNGALVEEVPLRVDAGFVFDVAVLESGTYVMLTSGSSPWVLVDRSGTQIDDVEPPEAFGDLTVLQRAGSIVHWKEDLWAFGFQTGNGWFTFGRDVPRLASPYVEHTDLVSANATRIPSGTIPSGVSLSVKGDTLAVLFLGKTRAASRVIDRYEMESGTYLNSLILPMRAKQAVVGPQRQIFVVTYDLFPTVVALVPRALSF